MTRQHSSRRPLASLGFVAVLAFVGGTLPALAPAIAQDAATTIAAPDANSGAADAPTKEAEEQVERKRKLRLAILTGGLIAVTGLALVILTILGGSATRRGLRRKPLAAGPPPLEPIPAARFDENALEEQAREPEQHRAAADDAT